MAQSIYKKSSSTDKCWGETMSSHIQILALLLLLIKFGLRAKYLDTDDNVTMRGALHL